MRKLGEAYEMYERYERRGDDDIRINNKGLRVKYPTRVPEVVVHAKKSNIFHINISRLILLQSK